MLGRILFIAAQYAGYLYLAYGVDRANFATVLGVFIFLFGGMVVFFRRHEEMRWKDIFWTALLFRAAFLLSEPRLSDDYFRFIWDGAMTVSGENPYLVLPESYVETEAAQKMGLDGVLYEGMNSKGYYTVYPPINQILFAIPVWIGQGNLSVTLFLMHLMLLLFEALFLHLILKLLKLFQMPVVWAMGYALNPLVISEITGNLHFEGVMLMFMALAVYWYHKPPIRGKYAWMIAAVPLAFAVSVKLTPLLLFPLIWGRIGKRIFAFGAVFALALALTFVPFYSYELWGHWQSSLDLYFRSFEFNASLYYLLREIGMSIKGYNPIAVLGPSLSLLTIGSITALALWGWRKANTPHQSASAAKWSYLVYYFLATTVHPWYAVIPAALAIFTRKKEAWIWSFLIVFSYAHYDGGGFQEHYAWIAAEYVILALVIFLPERIKTQFRQNVLNGFPG